MQKILNQLSTLSLAPKTKKEKLFHWFYNNERQAINRGILLTPLGSFLVMPFIKNILAPKILQFKPHLEGIDYANFFIGGMGICLTVWLCISALLSSWSVSNRILLGKRYHQNILNYLKTYHEDTEVKEFIIKMKLFRISKTIPKNNLIDSAHDYIQKIEDDFITEKDLINTENTLANYDSCIDFLESYKVFFEMSIDEIKLILNQKIANQLKEDQQKHQKMNHFTDKFTQNDEAIFKQVKTLKTSL